MVSHFQRVMAARAIAFYGGFAVMTFEIVLARVLTPFFGGSVYTWGAVIGVFLMGMTVGFYLGGRLADQLENPRWAGWVAGAAGLLVLATPPLTEPVGILLLDSQIDPRWGAAAAAAIFGAAPAALFAMLSPYAIKLALSDLERTGSIAGQLSALNSFGSIAGTLLTTFVFIPNFGGKAIIYTTALSSLVLGAVLLAGGRRLAPAVATAAGLMAAVALTPIAPPADASEGAAARRFGNVIETAESLYNNIFIVERGGVTYMTFGYQDQQYVESAFDPEQPDELVVAYTRHMPLGLLYNDKVESAAFVGLGGGRTARYLAETFDTLSVSVAEIDADVVRLAKSYFQFEESDRLSAEVRDGRIFLYRSRAKYDYVFLDAYRGPFVPFHLTTREFYQLCKRRLNEGGVVVQNVEPSTLLLDSTYATLDAVFDHVDAYQAGGNLVLVAYDGEAKTREELETRASEINAEHAPRYDLAELLDNQVMIQLDESARVLTDDFAPVELLHSVRRGNAKWK